MELVTQLIGRFHPLLVHLPIGMLILAFLFEGASLFRRYRWIKKAVGPSLFVGALFSLLAAISGYCLSQEGGYNERLLNNHQLFAYVTVILSIMVFVARTRLRRAHLSGERRSLIQLALFVPLMTTLSLAGHFGGSLTHGEAFLSADIAEPERVTEVSITVANVDEAVLYRDIVRPIFEARCYACHSAKKQKGDLRLDSEAFLLDGGEHGPVIHTPVPDSSALYTRLMLPLEDEHHMPPEDKTQLSSAEIAIIHQWLLEGASFDKKVRELARAAEVKRSIDAMQSSAQHQHWVPSETVATADPNVIASLGKNGVIVLPLSQESHYLQVNFINKHVITPEDLEQLLKLKEQLVWLGLGGTTISNEQMSTIGKLDQLRYLFLDRTSLTDEGVAPLKNLRKLEYLNLSDTPVGDSGVAYLTDLKNLKHLYIFNTAATAHGLQSLTKIIPSLKGDTRQYDLPFLASDTVTYKRF